MPTYVYAVVNADGSLGEHFEVVQRMSDAALEAHPETGAPVRRVPQMPYIGGNHTASADKRKVSDSNLERLGFTKYQKTGDGKYEKTAGAGPKSISAE
jgi:predicted nucleic acid-binding Zn ribbon protein